MKRFLACLVCGCALVGPLVFAAVKDVGALKTEVATNLADNVAQQISAGDVRNAVLDAIDSVRQGTVTTLTTAIAISDTIVNHPTLDELVARGNVIIVEPYTTDAEARRVVSLVGGVTVNLPFGNAHAIGAKILILKPGEALTPELFGAVGDGASDDSAAIQASLNTLLDISGGAKYPTEINGNYRGSGIILSADNRVVRGTGTIKLIDSSPDTFVLHVTGDGNRLEGFTLRGNFELPPDQSLDATGGGNALTVSGNDNVIDGMKFHDARAIAPAADNSQSNLLVTGDRNIVKGCQSYDAGYNLYRNAGDHNQFLNNYGRVNKETGSHTGADNAATLTDGTKSWTVDEHVNKIIFNTADGSSGLITANTATTITATLAGGVENDWDSSGTADTYEITSGCEKGFNNVGGVNIEQEYVLLDGFDLNCVIQCDWASAPSAAVARRIVCRNCRVVADFANDGDSTGAKFARCYELLIDGCHFESQMTMGDGTGGEGLVFAERLFDVVLTNSTIIGSGNASGAPIRGRSFSDPDARHVTINHLYMDNLIIGDPKKDPQDVAYTPAIEVCAYDTTLTNSTILGSTLLALTPWPNETRGVEELLLNTPPGSPVSDRSYVIGGAPTGVWGPHPFAITHHNGIEWVFESANPTQGEQWLLHHGIRVWNKNVSGGGTPSAAGFYEYVDQTTGWQLVPDTEKHLRIENNLYIGTRTPSGAISFVGSIAAVQFTRTDQVVFLRNRMINRGPSGTVSLTSSSSITPIFQQLSSNAWYGGDAAPAAGVWATGNRIFDSTPAPRFPQGWTCTTAGTAGSTAVFTKMPPLPLVGSTTWDPGNIAIGSGETHSFTVTGAVIGDHVTVSAPYDLQDLQATAYVQTGNTVEIRLDNNTAGAVDLGSGSWKVAVTLPP